ncbi:MAG: outer membrane protein assembly factor BamA [Treponema sp.]|nr:outer membrane protein assembly factor BamA [Treponema sp.]
MKFFKRFCLILLFTATVLPAQEEWYEGKPIKDIVLIGVEHTALSDLEGILSLYKDKPCGDDAIIAIQDKLYALEYFDEVIANPSPYDNEGSGVRIEITVKERPIVVKIAFIGYHKVKATDLKAVVSTKENDVLNEIKLDKDLEAIRSKYIEKGFPSMRVRYEITDGKKGGKNVTFHINEGDKLSIEAFVFEGNTLFSSKTLQRQLVSKVKSLANDGAYSDAALIQDRAAILKYYRDRGYMDAQVVDVTSSRREDPKKEDNYLLTITFNIREGQQYRFGGIEIEGNEIFSTEELLSLVRSKEDDIINGTRLDADLNRIVERYYENGYIFNTIDPEPLRDNDVFSYKITIVERGRAHIENIIIRGNEKTKDAVILREISMEPGDVFSRTKVMDGITNLYNLQFFSNVQPDMQPGSDENLMNLIFNVEEQPTMNIQAGLTFSGTADPDEFPVSGLFKWSDLNFMGMGNMLGVELNGSTTIQSVSLEYTQRYLFGLPMSVSFDLTFQHAIRQSAMDNKAPYFYGDEERAYPDGFDSYDDYYDAGKIPPDEYLMDYTQWKLSFGVSTGYRWRTPVGIYGLGGGVRFGVVVNTYDDDIYRPFDPTIRNRNNQLTPSNSLFANTYLDDRDIYYDPTKGFYLSQRFGFYGIFPIEPEHYFRSDTKAEAFFTPINLEVTEKWSFMTTFGFHSGVSFLFPHPFSDKPIVENANKLAIDGMFNARGWSNEYSKKGSALWENWVEMRIPIVPRVLALDFFFDAAEIQPDWATFWSGENLIDNLRFSFGAGIRFTIPQFPLRLSFAKRFKITDGAIEWQKGAIWAADSNPNSGVDVVLSFAIATY